MEQADVLGQVTLPASLLAAAEGFSPPPSRINFMFFSSTNLFQVSGSVWLVGDSSDGGGAPITHSWSPSEGAAGARPQQLCGGEQCGQPDGPRPGGTSADPHCSPGPAGRAAAWSPDTCSHSHMILHHSHLHEFQAVSQFSVCVLPSAQLKYAVLQLPLNLDST